MYAGASFRHVPLRSGQKYLSRTFCWGRSRSRNTLSDSQAYRIYSISRIVAYLEMADLEDAPSRAWRWSRNGAVQESEPHACM